MPDVRGKDELKSSEGEGSLPENAAAVAAGFGGEEREGLAEGDAQGVSGTKGFEGMGRAV